MAKATLIITINGNNVDRNGHNAKMAGDSNGVYPTYVIWRAIGHDWTITLPEFVTGTQKRWFFEGDSLTFSLPDGHTSAPFGINPGNGSFTYTIASGRAHPGPRQTITATIMVEP